MNRHIAVTLAFLLLAGSALAPRPARAADPNLADYVFDGSRVFWFAWITDTHIDSMIWAGEEDKLQWATGEAITVVQPWFLVNTGDLTDSTDGFVYGTGPHEGEWVEYRGFIDEAGLGAEYYFDIPGNHDAYGDGVLEYYRRYSVQGSTDDQMQHQWRLDFPFGSYHFVGVATPGNDGAQWPLDNKAFTVEEMDQTQGFFDANPDVDLAFVFGHHDYTGCDRANVLRGQMNDAGAAYYFHGHEHDVGARIDGANVLERIASLGQSNDGNFAVVAVDADAVSETVVSAGDPWPLIVVTAPVDARLGPGNDVVNPYAPPVPITCDEAPVRALVFDSAAVASARFRWDGGAWTDMARWPAMDAQWRGRFDSSTLAAGTHELTVEATGSATRSITIQVDTIGGDCNLGPEDPPGGDADADADADGDAGGDVEEAGDAAADADADATADADAPAADVAGDAPGDAAEADGSFKSGGGGCGCRTTAGPSDGWAFLALVAGLLVAGRRRRC